MSRVKYMQILPDQNGWYLITLRNHQLGLAYFDLTLGRRGVFKRYTTEEEFIVTRPEDVLAWKSQDDRIFSMLAMHPNLS